MEYVCQTTYLTYILFPIHNPLEIRVFLPILQIRKLRLIKS